MEQFRILSILLGGKAEFFVICVIVCIVIAGGVILIRRNIRISKKISLTSLHIFKQSLITIP